MVMSIENKPDNIVLEEKYKYSVNISVGLQKEGDFYIKLDFNNVTMDSLPQLIELFKLPKALKFESDLLTKEGYKISHIVAKDMHSDNNPSMQWECMSDDPTSLILEKKATMSKNR